jgi:uncharacterized damage-inducible protein DinB
MIPFAQENPLVALFRHNTWATLRLLDACATLSEEQLAATVPGTRGTIRDTLVHIVGNEEHYAMMLTGQPLATPLPRGEWPGIAALREHAVASGAALAAMAATAQGGDLARTEWQGQEAFVPVPLGLLQAINHATEHRTHITTILTQEGVTPPALDGWAYGDALFAEFGLPRSAGE